MLQPYLILISSLGLTGIFYRRQKLLVYEKRLQKSFEREQRKASVVAREKNPLRVRLTLEEKQRKISDSLAQVNSFIRKAEVHFAREEWKATEKLLVQALALDDANPKANNLLGLTFLHQGEWSRAELIFRKLTELEPKEASHFGNLGLALYYQENYVLARAAYLSAIQLDEQKPTRFLSLGQIYLKLGNVNAAINAFHKAVVLDKRNLEYLTALAESYELAGKITEAQETYAQILEYAPYNEEAKAKLEGLRKE